jgi:hypothetical protein
LAEKIRKLQGRVIDKKNTGETITDEKGNEWERCIFTVELTNFSKRTPNEIIPEEIKRRKVRLVRYCCFDWHYKLGIRKTLEPDETKAVLTGNSTETVYQ